MRDKIHLNLHSANLVKKAKEKILFRTQRQPVEAGAHGTLEYTIKKGENTGRIAKLKKLKKLKRTEAHKIIFSLLIKEMQDKIHALEIEIK